jgi:hypothetical protein
MRRMLAVLVLSACAAPDPGAGAAHEIEERDELVELEVTASHGPDQTPRRRLAFRGARGGLEPVSLEAIAFVPRFGRGAALIDSERRLYEVWRGGQRRMLADHAVGELAVSDGGELLAYVIVRDLFGALKVHDGDRERTIASGLASIGVLRVMDDEVAFVGAAPGGIAGVWSAPLDGSGARCHTNCDLRTGTDWRPRFVAPPSAPDALEAVLHEVRR